MSRLLGRTGRQFEPLDIAGCVLWLRSDLGVTKDGSNLVSLWADQSGNGNDFSQNTDASKPVWTADVGNGLPGLTFDGATSDILTGTFTQAQPNTWFVAFKYTSGLTAYRFLFDGSSTRQVFYNHLTSKWTMYADVAEIGDVASDNDAHYAVVIFNGVSSQAWLDGVSIITGNPGTSTVVNATIGRGVGDSGIGGWIAEIGCYSSTLSDSDRLLLQAYLAARYRNVCMNLTQWPRSGSWNHISNPRGIYSSTYNKTYFGAVAAGGTVWVMSYNHSDGTHTPFCIRRSFEYDGHAAPSILIRNDGRLMVFYSKHIENYIFYRISINPGDISSFGPEHSLDMGAGVTYTRPIQLSGESNKIYLFFRGLSTNSWSYITSTDGGDTWSSIQTLFTIVDQNNQYLVVTSNGVDRIDFGHCGHPALEVTSHYHFYYYNGNFYKSDGTLIETALPLSRSDMTLVYDATEGGHYTGWTYDIAIAASVPYIVFSCTVDISDHRYMYAKWNGSAWVHYEITTAGGEPSEGATGAICLDPTDPNTVYLSKEVNGIWEIQKGVTSDGGASWDFTSITSGSAEDNLMPVVPIGRHNDLPVLWVYGDYDTYLTYDTYIISNLWS